MKPQIFIDGEHGTTGLQIRNRLVQRADLNILSIPEMERHNKNSRAQLLDEADIAILCLPDDASREMISWLKDHHSIRIIDTSTAHRVHPDWVYGFAELDKAQSQCISSARFVANPGCYSTGAIALIRPLRAANILPDDYPITIHAVSGYTGGGKRLIAQMEDSVDPDYISANHFLYGLSLQHKHVPEITLHSLLKRQPIFSPSVGRFPQGLIVQVPLYLSDLKGVKSLKCIHSVLTDHYAGQNGVKVVSLEKSCTITRLNAENLNNTDIMELYVFGTESLGRANLVALFDNLGKGAAGAAVQNLDLMLPFLPDA